jgi:uncharacterized protein (TIGR03083 family)
MMATRLDEVPPVGRTDAEVLAATEYRRLAEQLRSLDGDDWVRPTDCPLWDVRAMAGHCVGMLSDFTSMRAMIRRMRLASRAAEQHGGVMIDAMTALQVDEHAGLTTDELATTIERRGPEAARWRTTAPRLLRAMPMKENVGGQAETWRLAFLFDTILTRDPWMHRVDIARATGRKLDLTPEHDGRIVADVVAEWARRHGRPFDLTLTGPAGGRFVGHERDVPPRRRADRPRVPAQPGDATAEALTLDAVEFCRILSGRAHGAGLLAQPVPF